MWILIMVIVRKLGGSVGKELAYKPHGPWFDSTSDIVIFFWSQRFHASALHVACSRVRE